MINHHFTTVLTTIQPPTAAVLALSCQVVKAGGTLLVMGDRKGPTEYGLAGTEFFSLEDQHDMGFELDRNLPVDHYTRKNLGYLKAIAGGSRLIYETDDDNEPLPNWALRPDTIEAVPAKPKKWLNAYQHFSNHNIWPRGFPLDEIATGSESHTSEDAATIEVYAPIQQGLANGSPDVDAIWRLVLDEPIEFQNRPSIWLPPGSWCPFNSQSTWWRPEAYPLMYLPSHCSFRMTDIWRSFIAQRCLWELGYGTVFHAPEVFQKRNEHSLMRDFRDEISGYLQNKDLTGALSELVLQKENDKQGNNLLTCYEALVSAGIFPKEELELVSAWLSDLAAIGMGSLNRI